MAEKEVEITGAPTLRGTLAYPSNASGQLPAVLIVVGSGKINRDGEVTKPKINLQLYKQMAEYITELGYITLRYDKRGVGKSDGDYMRAGMWDVVNDAKRAVEYLAGLPEVDPNRIVVLGHSEGSTIVTALNAVRPLNGLILLAGAGERLEEAMQRQRDIAHADMNKQGGFKGWLIRTMKVAEKSERTSQKLLNNIRNSNKDIIRFNLIPMNAKWFREHLIYDVVKDLEKIESPVLAITGKQDVQANAEKLQRVRQLARGEVETHAIESMDHSMKRVDGQVNMLEYRKYLPTTGPKPLHDELKAAIKNWLERHYPIH